MASKKNDSVPAAVQSPILTLSERRGLRIKEAAAYLGVSPWWMEVAVREKRIPAYKPQTNYHLIFKDDLDIFIERVRSGGAS